MHTLTLWLQQFIFVSVIISIQATDAKMISNKIKLLPFVLNDMYCMAT